MIMEGSCFQAIVLLCVVGRVRKRICRHCVMLIGPYCFIGIYFHAWDPPTCSSVVRCANFSEYYLNVAYVSLQTTLGNVNVVASRWENKYEVSMCPARRTVNGKSIYPASVSYGVRSRGFS